ncbi:Tn3 family transposase [Citrobacter amalonaticus]|uniref:Tn3 family transposase n=1 Tax=Citrobacter amalonaticus TaxID=35703 RepID=UPI0015E183A6|nr:Tn3 family transposase [Citrobacter amalonaticus]
MPNAVILWNIIYIQAPQDHLRNKGETIIEEDEARVSPPGYAYINMPEHDTFTLAEQLRPLKQAEETDDWQLTVMSLPLYFPMLLYT